MPLLEACPKRCQNIQVGNSVEKETHELRFVRLTLAVLTQKLRWETTVERRPPATTWGTASTEQTRLPEKSLSNSPRSYQSFSLLRDFQPMWNPRHRLTPAVPVAVQIECGVGAAAPIAGPQPPSLGGFGLTMTGMSASGYGWAPGD